MKFGYRIKLIVLALLVVVPMFGQSDNSQKKSIRQRLKEYKEKYEGKTIYVISRDCFPAPYEYSMTCVVLPPFTIKSKFIFETRDSSIVINKLLNDQDKYICSKVYLTHKNNSSGKPDAIAIELLSPQYNKKYPVLIYGWDSSIDATLKTPIELRTNAGVVNASITYPQNILIVEDNYEEELEPLRCELQREYSEKLRLSREEVIRLAKLEEARLAREAEKRRQEEEARLAREAEKRRQEAEKKRQEEEARLAREAEQKRIEEEAERKRAERIAFLNSLDVKSTKQYTGEMTKPKWIEELFESSSNSISGSYSYFSIYNEEEEEERIPHGKFSIKYWTGIFEWIEITGCFNRGERDGVWTIRGKLPSGEYDPYYYYSFQYNKGTLNGPFCFKTRESVDKSEISGTFLNGLINDAVIIKTSRYPGGFNLVADRVISGKVNDSGNPDGAWKETMGTGIPKSISRLYYDGCLIYRKETDESSGQTVFTYQISNAFRKPSDISKIHKINCLTIPTLETDEGYFRIESSDDILSLFYWNFIPKIYPGFMNWNRF